MYADDTKSRGVPRLNEAINEDLPHLDTWLISNKLSLNLPKTHLILVSTKAKRNALDKLNQNLQVKINGTELRL